jgi:hypothetical protein
MTGPERQRRLDRLLGADPVFAGAADFDLGLLGHRTLDGHLQELVYRPVLH